MAFKVKFSEQAATDLDEILTYLSETLYAPQAAQRFYDAVSKQLGILADNPRIYPLHRDDRLNAPGLRFVTMGNYLLFYTVDDIGSIVYIARILYGKRDLGAVFE